MGLYTEEIKSGNLENLLNGLQYFCSSYEDYPHPECERAIEEIKQEIILRFNVLNNKLNTIVKETSDHLTFQ